jgi:hypothetical protein
MVFVGKRRLLMALPALLLISASFSSLPAGADVAGCSTNTEPVALSPQVTAAAGQLTPACSFPIFGPRILARGHVDGIGLVGMSIRVEDLDGGVLGGDACGPVLNSCDTVATNQGRLTQLAFVVCTWNGVVAVNAHLTCEAESDSP